MDPEEGISLDLAEERARSIENVRYDLTFTIPSALSEAISGREVLRFFVRKEPAGPLVLDFAPGAPFLNSLSIGGKPAGYRNVHGHIVIPREGLVQGENTIEIVFRAGETSLNRNPDFLYTLFVPARAHFAFPCFDQPDLKARFTLELMIPGSWRAVANGPELTRD